MTKIDETISPDDHMMTEDIASYMHVARDGLDSVLAGLREAGRPVESVASILDFGSGYGRVYRALAAGFPNAKLTASDLMAPAAQFCAETFGGDWVQSHENLDEVNLPRKYDVVWLGSVFTHLPSARWHSLLDFLARWTEIGALVVFTSHGEQAIAVLENHVLKLNPGALDAFAFTEMKKVVPSRGFYFIPNKAATITHQQQRGINVSEGEYGFSFATEAWVRKLIQERMDWECVSYVPRGWGNNHDVITIRRVA